MWRKRDACESLAVELPKGARRRRYEVTVVTDVWPLRRPREAVAAAVEAESGAFWRERARRFHLDAHFPALVTEQLLWRGEDALEELDGLHI